MYVVGLYSKSVRVMESDLMISIVGYIMMNIHGLP